MVRLNSYNPESFRRKFKRDPKIWTIDQLHALYLKSSERHELRWREVVKVYDEVLENIEKGDGGKHYIYFTQVSNDREYLRQYEIRYDDGFKSYCHSIGEVKLDTRESRLDFLLGNQRAFELGEKFRRLTKLSDSSRFTKYKIREILWKRVEEQLQRRDESETFSSKIDGIFTIKIGGRKYYVSSDKHSRYYTKFELLNEVEDDILEIS